MISRRAVVLVLGLSLVGAGPALASHPKTDILTLDSGDQFHGEIKKLQQGALTVDTPSVGTLSVKWGHVARLVSEYDFEVQDVSGARHFGRLVEPDRDGELKVVGRSGAVTLPMTDVFWLAPIEQGFLQKLDGSVNFGFSYTQGNEAIQYSLSATCHYLTRSIGADLQLSSMFNTQEDAESVSQQNLSLTVLRPLSALNGRANIFALGQVQSNPNQGYDLRSVGGGGFGLFLRQMSGGFTLVNAGIVLDREDVAESTEVTSNAQALLSLRFSRYRTDSPKRSINLGVTTFTYLTDSPRFRAQVSFDVGFEIVHNLNVSLNVLNSYDSRPATADASKNDLSVTSSLGYSF